MISSIQKSRLINKILKSIYLTGKSPSLQEVKSKLAKLMAGKVFGLPLFSPRMVAGKDIVSPDILKNNLEEIKEDIETLFDATLEIVENEAVTFGSVTGEIQELKQSLIRLKEELETKLHQEGMGGKEVLFDNFKDNSKINLEKTTAFISTSGGFITLPIDQKTSSVLSPSTFVKVNESLPKLTILGDFMQVFSGYGDRVWQASLENDEEYVVDINLTGKGVVPGHSNEVEINNIYVDPLTPIDIAIYSSTDGLNWDKLIGESINSARSFSIPPVWCLYLRFVIRGNGIVGIRHMSIGKVGTLEKASLYSKKLTAENSLYNLTFNTKEVKPTGTSISHYISFSEGGPWLPVSPGKINLQETVFTSKTFSTEAALDATTGLYVYGISETNAIPQGSELKRGISQFKVSAFAFDWKKRGEPNHIPHQVDYEESLGNISTCYMSSAGTYNNTNIAPTGIAYNRGSFIINFTTNNAVWWGVPLIDNNGLVLMPNYNYKITTYLYSDREILLTNAGGGIYALGGTFTDVKGIGWALVVNGTRVAYDNSIFVVSNIPDNETFTSSTGRSFPLSLRNGWNKVELLIYVPDAETLGASILSQNMVLLLRPDIINFVLQEADNWNYVPKQNQYPIWADGVPLKRVSEFVLRWNVKPMDNNYWAWRISPATNNISDVLLNYNPATATTTIDGKYFGSDNVLQVKYALDYNPTNTIYYRCDLSRNPNIVAAPELMSYEFISTIRE